MKKYKRTQIEVEAVKFSPSSMEELDRMKGVKMWENDGMVWATIDTPDGNMVACFGDWIAKHSNGTYHVFKSGYFPVNFQEVP